MLLQLVTFGSHLCDPKLQKAEHDGEYLFSPMATVYLYSAVSSGKTIFRTLRKKLSKVIS